MLCVSMLYDNFCLASLNFFQQGYIWTAPTSNRTNSMEATAAAPSSYQFAWLGQF